MNLLRTLASFILLWLAACGGSGGTADSRHGAEPGSVVVVIDTRTGDDTLVQFQVAGATLEDAAGLQTPNLLRQSEVVTFDDPHGETSGLRLWSVPSARYEALHLILVPGSGYALDANGDARAVQGPVDVRVPIAGGLLHSATASSWLVVGPETVLQRRASNGPGTIAIPLAEVQPGVDFVWVRGEVTTPPTVAASRVRVRAQ